MEKQTVIYLIMTFMFIGGSIYNFKHWKKYIYTTRLTKPRLIILLIASFIFLGMAHFISDGSWENYLLAVLASIFLLSSMKEGMNEKGVYYHSPGTGSFFVRLGKWEDIKDIRFNTNKNKLESMKLKRTTIFLAQYYNLKDMDEINKYIKMKMKNNQNRVR